LQLSTAQVSLYRQLRPLELSRSLLLPSRFEGAATVEEHGLESHISGMAGEQEVVARLHSPGKAHEESAVDDQR